MKKESLALLSALFGVLAHTQEILDSIDAQTLNEVVVEAAQITSAKVSVYYPSARQKEMADDATSLLALMNIPQLSVSATSGTIKTVGGKPVFIFIDYVEASEEDISGLNPRDAKKVEYYNNPSDPRFLGRKYVVNFIMQKYEWGGYTKLDASQSIGVPATSVALYTKVKYKDMDFDIYAGEKYNTVHHAGNESTEYMRFTNLYGKGAANIERRITESASNAHDNTNDVSIRALYNTSKMQLNNRIGLNFFSVPQSETTNAVRYGGDISGSTCTTSTNSNNNLTVRHRGQYLFYLPNNLTLNVGSRLEFGRNKVEHLYNTSKGFSIANNANENSLSGTLNPNLNWQANDSHSLSAYVVGLWKNNKIDYSGDNASRQTYEIDGYMTGGSYDFDTEKWNAHLNFGWTWQNNTISNYNVSSSYPKVNASITYTPSQNSQIYASYEYHETFPEASSTSPVLLRQDELTAFCGNPGLKNSPTQELALQGIWLPNNKWQLALTGFHYNISGRRVAEYTPNGPEGTMLRHYTNNGNYRSTMFGFNVTAKFFGGQLIARANPQFWSRNTTGVFAMTRNELTCTAQLTYYLGNFYAMGWYMTPSHYPDENSGIETKTPSQYQVKAGWGKNGWNINVSASNFLRTDWRSTREILQSEYYNLIRNTYNPAAHMKFTLSTTYTIGYGKKVERSPEIGAESPTSSAILQ